MQGTSFIVFLQYKQKQTKRFIVIYTQMFQTSQDNFSSDKEADLDHCGFAN